MIKVSILITHGNLILNTDIIPANVWTEIFEIVSL